MSSHNYKSVLPDNSTPVMRAIETAFRSQLESVNDPFPELLNPALTPQQFLSALAKENGVDDWFSGDSEQEQRETTSGSLIFQKKAGTRTALKESLLALGISSEVKKGNLPYSITANGQLSEQPMTSETAQRISVRVSSYKSERDVVSLTLSRKSNCIRHHAVVVKVAKFVNVSAYSPFNDLSMRIENCCLLGFN